MTARRPVVTSLTAFAALAAVAGCQRPTPAVTLVSSGQRVRTESASFCRGGQTGCVRHPDRREVLRVREGDLVGIDVDKALSDSGWDYADADLKQRSSVQDKHYLTFKATFINRPTPGVIDLVVRSRSRVAEDAPVTGVWNFQLVQR